jgi:hypothetical protein
MGFLWDTLPFYPHLLNSLCFQLLMIKKGPLRATSKKMSGKNNKSNKKKMSGHNNKEKSSDKSNKEKTSGHNNK